MNPTRFLLPILLLLLAGATTALEAQVKIDWKLLSGPVKGKPGEVVNVKVQGRIPSGHHVTATNPKLEDIGALPMVITVGEKNILTLGGKIRPERAPIRKYDEGFEDTTEYWEGNITFTVPVRIAKTATAGQAEGFVDIYHQICDEVSCQLPIHAKIPLTIEVAAADSVTTPGALAADSAKKDTATVVAATDSTDAVDSTLIAANDTTAASDAGTTGAGVTSTGDDAGAGLGGNDEIAEAREKGLGAYLLLAAAMGLGALATPCVFPMIPITVSFFTKRTTTNKKKSLRDAGLYSFGIISTFTLLGFLLALIFGATGISDFASNPTVNLIVAAIFLLLALNLFGMFEIQVPSSILNKLNKKAAGEGDSVLGVMMMGLVFSLTSFTCTVPFVGGLVVSAVSTGEWLWPMMGTAVFATVFSAPFFLLALFPALLKSLPKSGGWLNSVKVVMGFLETAAAIKFISNADIVLQWGVFTREFFLATWIAIAVLITVYLLGKFHLPHDSFVERVGPFRVVLSTLFLAVGFWMLTGLFGGQLGEIDAFLPPQDYPGKGNTSMLANIPGATSSGKQLSNPEDTWHKDEYDKALALAKKEGKPVFIDFTGYTCTNCRWMEKNMFPREDVASLMSKYVLLKLYLDGPEEVNKKNQQLQLRRFKTTAMPFYAVVSPDDSVVTTFPGMTRKSEKFVQFLEKGLTGHGDMAAK